MVLTAETPVATPVNWFPTGDRVFVQPSVDSDSAHKMFGKVDVKEVPSGKVTLSYLMSTFCNPCPVYDVY